MIQEPGDLCRAFSCPGVLVQGVPLEARAISTGALDAPACTGVDILKMPAVARDVRFVKSGGID
jgi:hypothetical protein